jgi:hypothetical protein
MLVETVVSIANSILNWLPLCKQIGMKNHQFHIIFKKSFSGTGY